MASTVNTKKLFAGTLPASTTSEYTVPSGNTILKNVVLTNINAANGAAGAVNVYVVPSGSTASTNNCVLYSYPVNANATVAIDFSIVMNSGDSLQVSQAPAGYVTAFISGVEVQ